MKNEQLRQRGVFQLHSITWTPEKVPLRGVVHLVHGMREYIDRYDPFAQFLSQQGFLVFGCDLPGHGHSVHHPDEYGYFADEDGWWKMEELLLQLSLELKAAHPDLPFFLMGHSMGSFLVRTLMIDHPNLADGYLLSGTAQPDGHLLSSGLRVIELALRARGAKGRNARIERLALGTFNKNFPSGRSPSDWVSRDHAVAEQHANDPLCAFFPSISLFRDMAQGLQYIANPENIAKMNPEKPIFIFSGDQDPIGDRGEGVKRVFTSFLHIGCQHVHLKLYPGGRHEMLNEINRDEVYGDVLDWLTCQLEVLHAIS